MTVHICKKLFSYDIHDFIIELNTDDSIANDVVFDDMICPFDEIRVICGLVDREMPSSVGDVVKPMLRRYINLHLQNAIDDYVKYLVYYYDDEMLDILARFHDNVTLPQGVVDHLLNIANEKEMPHMAAILLELGKGERNVSEFLL